jgi:hypothetical protein
VENAFENSPENLFTIKKGLVRVRYIGLIISDN